MKKKNIVLALVLSLLAPIVGAAKTAEQAYIDSYASRSGTLKPVSVVIPTIGKEWAGRALELVFVVNAHGRPRNIKSNSRVPIELRRQIERAIMLWRFKPKLDANGKPVAVKVKLPVQIKPSDDRTAILHAAN